MMGKSVLVLGASSAIGKLVVDRFIIEGWSVLAYCNKSNPFILPLLFSYHLTACKATFTELVLSEEIFLGLSQGTRAPFFFE